MNRGKEPEKLIVGVDLGATKISSVLADPSGSIKRRDYRDTQAERGPEVVIGRLTDSIRKVIGLPDEAAKADISGIGIGAAGPCDLSEGVVLSPPNLPGWRNVPLKSIIEREFNLPAYLNNDANVAALGEYYFGAGVNVDNLIYVTVSTGIGGGIIIDGKLYCGASGTAGEIGHMTIDVNGPRCHCGNIGCWEALASGLALAREATRKIEAGERTSILEVSGGDLKRVSAQTVFLAAQQSDPLARELISQLGRYLGVGLANLVNLFNPKLILIGGGLSQMGPLLLEPAIEVVKERAFEQPAGVVRIAPAQLGADAGTLGAVALVLYERPKNKALC